ncbi:MAG: hypothetical protein WAO76_05060 [Georgfuchsia sp.]
MIAKADGTSFSGAEIADTQLRSAVLISDAVPSRLVIFMTISRPFMATVYWPVLNWSTCVDRPQKHDPLAAINASFFVSGANIMVNVIWHIVL